MQRAGRREPTGCIHFQFQGPRRALSLLLLLVLLTARALSRMLSRAQPVFHFTWLILGPQTPILFKSSSDNILLLEFVLLGARPSILCSRVRLGLIYKASGIYGTNFWESRLWAYSLRNPCELEGNLLVMQIIPQRRRIFDCSKQWLCCYFIP